MMVGARDLVGTFFSHMELIGNKDPVAFGRGRRVQMRHIRLLLAPRDHIVIEYPLSPILMPHGPSHRFIVVSIVAAAAAAAGSVGRAAGAPPQEGRGS